MKFHSFIEYVDNFTCYVVLKGLKMHGSIVYFDISMWLWSWKTWNFTDLLQFYWYTVMSWSCNGSFDSYEAWWVLWWLFFSLNEGIVMKWNVMHWLTCGQGRGSPASDSLTLSGWSSAVTSANAGPNPLHDWIDSECCLHGLLWCTRRWTLIPGSEGWSDQVFNCMGTSRTRDVCSKCTGMFMKLKFWWDEWWDTLLDCVIHLLASGGFLHPTTATMYHFYNVYVLYLYAYMVAWQITLKLVCLVESFIMSKCNTKDVCMLMMMQWSGNTNEHEMGRTSQLIYSSSSLKTPELSCPASACSSLATVHQAEAVCAKPCIFMSEVSGSVGQ